MVPATIQVSLYFLDHYEFHLGDFQSQELLGILKPRKVVMVVKKELFQQSPRSNFSEFSSSMISSSSAVSLILRVNFCIGDGIFDKLSNDNIISTAWEFFNETMRIRAEKKVRTSLH